MIFPIRCFTCSKVIGDKWDSYKRMLQEDKSKKEIFNSLGISRYCCTRMFTSHIETIDKILIHEH